MVIIAAILLLLFYRRRRKGATEPMPATQATAADTQA